MILIIDNYDSFTYNLYQEIGSFYPDLLVVRNDQITLAEIEALQPEALVLSPGPGFPASAGITIKAIQHFAGKIPMLGVCLGLQAIGEAFGGRVVHASEQVHGKSSMIELDTTSKLFEGLPAKVEVARYHSLVLETSSLPETLKVTAKTSKGEIMAAENAALGVYGVQFHPESVLTPQGKAMLYKFVTKVAGLKAISPVAQAPVSNEEKSALKRYLFTVAEGGSLTADEAESAMGCIMDGGATDAQIAAFMTALRMKGESVDEITGFARAMISKAATVKTELPAVDIVGTGGDLSNTFNISTTTAFVVAGAGQPVAKHGNRSVSSRSGSADVLEQLGVRLNLTPEQALDCLEKTDVTFMFAPAFHGSMRHAATPRRELGLRSVFNILGPLSNPAGAPYMVLGVYDEKLVEVLANVLVQLGVKGALVVHGSDGLDEVTLTGPTTVCEIKGGQTRMYTVTPEEMGLTSTELVNLVGGSPEENAKITLDILNGMQGPKRDVVLMNAAAALVASGKVDSFKEGIEAAKASIDSGRALAKLKALVDTTQRYGA
ncbi:anthranilate phosphoribosyltransferase [Acidaminobacter hydrogenoformans]|uniref:Anthranilate phosphoribosyltransferase n=1 Tax=Acidaminobacter hydrogenoformans DSM 2784 TaxID=1120920 RepID=A0A1G5RR89_9FIRM|nr:anthranilate phosphoribosyltransferase [Acidaminobacter hydrogenoformans]SCZ76572.1 anthranilate synthase, component II [Acidaminobacter hydrogenoformans DSM 2784]